MMIIPAIDIMNHQVVQLVGGVPGTEKVTLPDPLAVAHSWVDKGAKYLHIVDLDAAFDEEDNLTVIKQIAQTAGVPVEVGGGIRKESRIRALLDAGVDRIIVGTRAITDMEWFREMSHAYPHKLVMGLDTKDGKATVKGWQESSNTPVVNILDSIRDLPVAGVLNTNVDVEGQGKGINEEWVAKFAKMCPHKVIASGGVTTEEDAKILAKYDTMAAVVGVAVYTGLTEPWNWSTPWEA